jgi:copper homeostasis protein
MPAGKVLEIACFNIESALVAQRAGADRIELCEDYKHGGVSPSEQMVLQVREKIIIPLHVIVRPRPGNFIYTQKEIGWMKHYILFCRQNKADGIVFGVLNGKKEVDVDVCSQLIECAGDMSVTFHRAIDETADISRSIQQLTHLKIHRILTSGGKANAIEGASEIERLQSACGKNIIIMPGGGIRSSNIDKVLASGCREYHSSAILHGEMANEKEIELLTGHLKNG